TRRRRERQWIRPRRENSTTLCRPIRGALTGRLFQTGIRQSLSIRWNSLRGACRPPRRARQDFDFATSNVPTLRESETAADLSQLKPDSGPPGGARKSIISPLCAATSCAGAPTARTVHVRRACIHPARKTMWYFAFCSTTHWAWAKAHYRAARSRGKRHAEAIRMLSNVWLRIIIAMLHNHRPLRSSRHLKAREARLAIAS